MLCFVNASFAQKVATAAALYQRGVKNIRVFEKATSLEPVGAAIGLFPNGFRALHAISPTAHAKVKDACVENRIMRILGLDGSLVRETDYSKVNNNDRVNATFLVWHLLQQFLAEDLLVVEQQQQQQQQQQQPGILQLGHALESFTVDESTGLVKVRVKSRHGDHDHDQQQVQEKTCRVLVGADGIHSTVRTQLFGEKDLQYHGKVMFRAVMKVEDLDAEICPPAGISVAYQGEEKGKLFCFRETAKDIMTITAMAVFETTPELMLMDTDEEKRERLKKIFQDYPENVQHIMDRVAGSAIYENAVYDIQVLDEWSKGPVVLLGDAAHAMTPGMGQGANLGLEDACELAHELGSFFSNGDSASASASASDDAAKIPQLLQGFWGRRIERVKTIHVMSSDMTRQVNQSSKTTSIPLLQKPPPSTKDIYDWKPSFSC
jgi:salicylate hydroxylase